MGHCTKAQLTEKIIAPYSFVFHPSEKLALLDRNDPLRTSWTSHLFYSILFPLCGRFPSECSPWGTKGTFSKANPTPQRKSVTTLLSAMQSWFIQNRPLWTWFWAKQENTWCIREKRQNSKKQLIHENVEEMRHLRGSAPSSELLEKHQNIKKTAFSVTHAHPSRHFDWQGGDPE